MSGFYPWPAFVHQSSKYCETCFKSKVQFAPKINQMYFVFVFVMHASLTITAAQNKRKTVSFFSHRSLFTSMNSPPLTPLFDGITSRMNFHVSFSVPQIRPMAPFVMLFCGALLAATEPVYFLNNVPNSIFVVSVYLCLLLIVLRLSSCIYIHKFTTETKA